MQKHLSSISLFCFILLSLHFLACGKEEVKDYSKYPIDLKVQKLSNGGFKYSWNAISTSDFKEYWIVKNLGDSVAFINENDPKILLQRGNVLIAKISNSTQTELIDSVNLVAGKEFVRIFAFLENRALSSTNVEIKGFDNLFLRKGGVDRVVLNKNRDEFCILDASSSQISLVDASRYTNSGTSFSQIDLTKELFFYDFGSASQLFVPGFNGSYSVLNLPNTSTPTINFFPFTSRSIAICKDKFMVFESIAALNSKNKNEQFQNSINATGLISKNKSSSFQLRWLKSRNEVWSLSVADSLSFLNSDVLQDNGFFAGPAQKRTLPLKLQSNSVINMSFVITPRELYALFDRQGTIVDAATFKEVGTLAKKAQLTNINYIDFTFSTDENFVYALRTGESSNDKRIDVFSYPSFDYVKSIPFKSTPKRLFFHANKLKLVGDLPKIANFTLFEVINP
jgi:hypothetical protein